VGEVTRFLPYRVLIYVLLVVSILLIQSPSVYFTAIQCTVPEVPVDVNDGGFVEIS
jgi:hypothetical protein